MKRKKNCDNVWLSYIDIQYKRYRDELKPPRYKRPRWVYDETTGFHVQKYTDVPD